MVRTNLSLSRMHDISHRMTYLTACTFCYSSVVPSPKSMLLSMVSDHVSSIVILVLLMALSKDESLTCRLGLQTSVVDVL